MEKREWGELDRITGRGEAGEGEKSGEGKRGREIDR